MKIVTFGELLIRFSPLGNLRFAQAGSYEAAMGGAEANLAISLAQYGNNVHYVTMVPDNPLGHATVREVQKWGVNVSGVQYGGPRMGLYFLEKGASLRGGNIIYDREGSSFAGIDANTFDWDALLDGADWFHWTGITPALSTGCAEATAAAIKVARKRNLPVSCDLNYRAKLWNYGASPRSVMPALLEGTTVVLANEHDVEQYLGIAPEPSDYEVVEGFDERCHKFISKALVERFPQLDTVVSTLRQTINASHNRWSGVVYKGGEFVSGQVHDIDAIVDRVGGGDSFMAAYVHGRLNYDSEEKALNFALAASALKLSIPGDYNIVTESEVLHLMNKQPVGRISR